MAPRDVKTKAVAAKNASVKGTHSRKGRQIRTTTTFHRPKTLRLARVPKYPRRSTPKRPQLDNFSVIKYPLTTETALKKIDGNNTIVFICDTRSNKPQIKAAVKAMYEIDCDRINTLVRPDGLKKAFVHLADNVDALEIANK
eukprot:Awhi_evm1s1001